MTVMEKKIAACGLQDEKVSIGYNDRRVVIAKHVIPTAACRRVIRLDLMANAGYTVWFI